LTAGDISASGYHNHSKVILPLYTGSAILCFTQARWKDRVWNKRRQQIRFSCNCWKTNGEAWENHLPFTTSFSI
jgi:hypothetical protein